MAYIFQNMAKQAQKAGINTALVKDARAWYYATAQGMTGVTPNRLLASEDTVALSSITTDVIGALCCYFYDPKLKKTLPYYDRFPMVFITDMRADGWLGINLHYLPVPYRAALMSSLYNLATTENITDKTRLNISYQILKRSAKSRYFKPCVKEYLAGHVMSEIKMISPPDWDKALLLPLQRFEKASAEQVWKDSVRAVG